MGLIAEVFDGERVLGTCALEWSAGVFTSVRSVNAESQGYVIPGLIDTHVHLGGSAGPTHVDGYSWPVVTPREEQSLHVAANCLRAARSGVTTLREMSGDGIHLAAARVMSQELLPGPKLLVSGQVGMSGGHGDLFWPRFLTQRPPVADSPDECRKLVRHWAREGCSTIKTYTSGGVLSVGDQVVWRNQTMAELEATVDEAHALGMQVACHAHSEEGIDIAIALGVDSIEHATTLTAKQASILAERGTPVAPTLLINDLIAAGQHGSTPEAQSKASELVQLRDERFRIAAALGVNFVLGTDANGIFLRHGDQWREMQAMGRVFEWEASRVLHAATYQAAASICSNAGRISVGAPADFILVPKRTTLQGGKQTSTDAPWRDLAALNPASITVYARGEQIPDLRV